MRYMKKYGIKTRAEALRSFLKLVRDFRGYHEFLVFYLADELELSREELLEGKKLQLEAQSEITGLR
jgi:hypothetical protein